MSGPEIIAQYEGRIGELQIGWEQARLHGAVAGGVFGIATLAFMMLALFAIRQQVSFLWTSTPVPLVAAAAVRLRRHQKVKQQVWRLRRFYENSLQRVRGNWAGNGFTGTEYETPSHPYAGDLDIFGEGSLFELLCTARTSIGRRRLADYLLEAPDLAETVLRQQAVQELAGRGDLREQIALLGEFGFRESRPETFEEWLSLPTLRHSTALSVTLLITAVVLTAFLCCGITALIPWLGVIVAAPPLLVFHAIIGARYLRRVRAMLPFLRQLSLEIEVLRGGIQLLEVQFFQSPKLCDIANRVRGASKPIRSLERMVRTLNQREQQWFYLPFLALCATTQLCWATDRWLVRHGKELRVWLNAWADFEALNALGNYAFENGEHCFPEFSCAATEFEAHKLGHPLIHSSLCVGNDIRLNAQDRFYLVSGSNMSGKSTLLRAIGLSSVLAFAGAPVRAQGLHLSRFSVYASLSVVDSLVNGKSKFMAEMDRLHQMLDAAKAGVPVLFLIDEILSGTNSRDRRIAAEAIVRTLVERGAIGALSTHDLALTDIAVFDELGGVNVHVGSCDRHDPMKFDYRLKPGVTDETNALAIARLAGVPV